MKKHVRQKIQWPKHKVKLNTEVSQGIIEYSFGYCQAGILIYSRKVTDISEIFKILK